MTDFVRRGLVAALAMVALTRSAEAYPILNPIVFNDARCVEATRFDAKPTVTTSKIGGFDAATAEVADGETLLRAICIRDAAIEPDEDKAAGIIAHIGREAVTGEFAHKAERQKDGSLVISGGGPWLGSGNRFFSFELTLANGAALARVAVTSVGDMLENRERGSSFLAQEDYEILSDSVCLEPVRFPKAPQTERLSEGSLQRVVARNSDSQLVLERKLPTIWSFEVACLQGPASLTPGYVRKFLASVLEGEDVRQARITETSDGDHIALHAHGYVEKNGDRHRYEIAVRHNQLQLIARIATYSQTDELRRRAADFLGLASPTAPSETLLTFTDKECFGPIRFPRSPEPRPNDDVKVAVLIEFDRQFQVSCGKLPSPVKAEELARGLAEDIIRNQVEKDYAVSVEKRGDKIIVKASGTFEMSGQNRSEAVIVATPRQIQFLVTTIPLEDHPNAESAAFLNQTIE